jgi:hypothetical protein
MHSLKTVGKVLIATAICFVIATAITEAVLRLTASPGANAAADIYVAHEGYTAYKPNLRFQFTNERGVKVEVATDAGGFRNDPGRERSARILLLGDSFVAAINTIEEATVAGQLRTLGYDVYNGGSDGSGTFNQLAIMEKLLAGGSFNAVVLLFFTGNDFHDNFMTQDAVVAATARQAAAAAETANSSDASFGTIAARPAWRQKILDACNRSRACQYFYNNVWLGQVRGYARDPWADRRYFHMYLMTGAARSEIDRAVTKTRVALDAMQRLAARAGVSFVVVSIPSRSEVYRSWYDFMVSRTVSSETLLNLLADTPADFDRPERTIRELCGELRIPYHSLLRDMRAAPLPMRLYGVLDEHWVAEGEAIGAKSIAEFLSKKGVGQ